MTPIQTSREEWMSYFDQFYPYFLEYLKNKATKVDAIEVYNPDTGDAKRDYEEFARAIKSLPARYDLGGVKKTVLVPLDLLSRDAKAAADEARTATSNANKATQEANDARDKANKAAKDADKAREDFEIVRDETLAAKDAANNAADVANRVAGELTKTNETIKAEESQRQNAENLREEAFREALSRFDESLTELDGFTELAKEAWNEFVKEYEAKQTDITQAEELREANEKARQESESKRETYTKEALEKLGTETERLKAFCDNPPKIEDGTWRVWSEDSGGYEDTGVDATGHSPMIDPDSHNWLVWDESKGEYSDTGINAEHPYELAIDADYFTKEFESLEEGEEEGEDGQDETDEDEEI